MKKITVDENKRCPKCGSIENQIRVGYNSSGIQRCKCKNCNIRYTPEPKKNTYSEETKQLALKMYYSGVSGRGVGKVLGMNKANVYNWIKKLKNNDVKIFYEYFELDELYWFINKKPCTKTRENVYIITMISREPRQIVGFDVAFDKSSERIQNIVDNAPEAKYYCTDGYNGYIDIVYPRKHIRNIYNKRDTFTVEGVNANLRLLYSGSCETEQMFSKNFGNTESCCCSFC